MSAKLIIEKELQPLSWGNPNNPEKTECLYYRGSNIEVTKERIDFSINGKVDFLTYFNLFNWNKWLKYTKVQNLILYLMLEGEFLIKIYSNTIPNSIDKVKEKLEILSRKISGNGLIKIPIPETFNQTIISFSLESIGNGKLYSGAWVSEIDPAALRKPKIALVMVTFKRDEYLYKNLELLKRELPDNYSVFIVDNGNRIADNNITRYGPKFKLFRNNNTGGSGGFTRGLIEALRSTEDFTHVNFMDDDVAIEASSLERTSTILSLLKEEYRESFISGAMFRMDTPWILHESTARWNGLRIVIHKNKLDVSNKDQLLFNEKEELSANQYAAWWFCVIPITKGIEKDLPLPFFIYGDDIEYSLRRAHSIIAWNGMCVWHEPFEKKHSAVLKSYFLCRNLLILNTFHFKKYGLLKVLISAAAHFFVQIFVHDYNSAKLVLDAYRDYLKGADFFRTCSNESILIQKRNNFPKMIPYNKQLLNGYFSIQLHYKKFKAPFYFFKKKISAFDFDRQNMELRKRSYKRVMSLSLQFIKLFFQMIYKYPKIKNSYKNQSFDITFWDAKNIPKID